MNNDIIQLSEKEGITRMTINPMPLWEGIQSRPGVRFEYPFSLAVEGGALIRQTTEKEIIDKVVQAYQAKSYTFITAPPGASKWANALGDLSVSTVLEAAGYMRPRSILEIGAGSLYVAEKLIDYFQPSKYIIVDPTVHDAMDGVEVIHDYFPHPDLGSRQFDLVLAFNCLEHVPDPRAFLDAIRTRMSPGGLAVLIYPDCEEQFRQGDLNALVHEHLNYFTEASSRWLISACGLRVNSLFSHHDTFMAVLSRSPDGQNMLPRPNEIDLFRESLTAFNKVLLDKAILIRDRLSAGRIVGFHGATNGLNIFLHLTRLGDHPRIRLYDGDDSKIGRYLPACSAPIMGSSDPSYRETGLMVVSAMSYFEPISSFAIDEVGLDKTHLMALAAI